MKRRPGKNHAHFLIRPIAGGDLDGLEKLAASIGGSLTSLPRERGFLADRIDDSLRAFDPKVKKPGGEHYLFVLEEAGTGRIVGTSGILSMIGGFEPFYSYETVHEKVVHKPLGVDKEVPALHLRKDHKGPAEICSLFLDPEYRKSGLGRLLSLSRFLFMAAFPERFHKEVIAEIRGFIDEKGESPFWGSVGRPFSRRIFTRLIFSAASERRISSGTSCRPFPSMFPSYRKRFSG